MSASIMESPGLVCLAGASYLDKAVAGWQYKLLASPPLVAYGALFGGDGYILAAFYILFFLDFFVGVAAALKNGRFRLKRLELWVVKFITFSLCIGIVGVVNMALSRSWGLNLPLLDTVLTLLIAGEALSIMENLGGLGCPVPPVFLKLAAGVKSRAGKKLDALLDGEKPHGEA